MRWSTPSWRLALAATVGLADCSGRGCNPPAARQPAGSAARRSAAELRLPPAAHTPPAEALRGPDGVRWLTLAPGAPPRPGERSSVLAELTAWTDDGTLVFSTYQYAGPSVFTMSTPPPFIREQLATLGVGGRARGWFPRGTVGVWAPPAWRALAMIIDLELIGVRESDAVQVVDAAPSPSPASRFSPPELSGPPPEAEQIGSGVRALRLAPGAGPPLSHAGRAEVELTAWQPGALHIGEPLLQARRSSIEVTRAGELAAALQAMRVGETVRLWLPAPLARALLALPVERETVVDLTVLAVE